jgi:hypothetical protein
MGRDYCVASIYESTDMKYLASILASSYDMLKLVPVSVQIISGRIGGSAFFISTGSLWLTQLIKLIHKLIIRNSVNLCMIFSLLI